MPTPGGETLGATLRRLREGRGLGVREFARLAGASHGSILDWEGDRFVPSGPRLDRLLAALEAKEPLRARLLARAAPAYARIQLARTSIGAPVEVGQVLKAMRLRRGMTQAEAARAVGVSQGALAKWETGDSAPSKEALHGTLFALGAAPEEALALMTVERQGGAPEIEDEEGRILRASFEVPIPLRDVVLLGLESELWWRATRDPSARALLGYAVASRAHQCLWRGALDELERHAQRAMDIARATGEHAFAAGAVYASNWVRQRRKGGAAEAAASLREWRDLTARPARKKWLTGAEATATIRAGDVEGGLALLEGLEVDAHEESWARVVYHRGDLAEALILAERPERALELLATLGGDARPRSVVKAQLALGKTPTPEAIAAVGAFDPADWLLGREAAYIGRLVRRQRAA